MMAGAFVVDVAADGPAAKAGIQARDVVVKVDGVAGDQPPAGGGRGGQAQAR